MENFTGADFTNQIEINASAYAKCEQIVNKIIINSSR